MVEKPQLVQEERLDNSWEQTVISWAQGKGKKRLWAQVSPVVQLVLTDYYQADDPDVRKRFLESASQTSGIPKLTIVSEMDQSIARLGQAWAAVYEKRHKPDILADYESDRVLKALVASSTSQQIKRLYEYPLISEREQEQFLFGLIKQNPLMPSIVLLTNDGFLSLLSPEQEEQLPNLIADSESVRDVAILANQRLVVSIARHFIGRSFYSYTFDDVLQEGKIGLIRAIDKFKPMMGFRFSTYATWWIRQSIYRALFEYDRTIRLPVQWNVELRRLAEEEEIAAVIEESLTPEEIAKRSGITTMQLEKLQGTKALDPKSLDRPAFMGPSGSTLADFVDDGGRNKKELDKVETSASAGFVRCVMDWILTEPEKEAIELHLIQDKTYPKAGAVMGVTGARVHQLYVKALKKLQANPELVDSFLDYQDSL